MSVEEQRLIDNLQKHAEKVRDDVLEKKRKEEALKKTTEYAVIIDKIIDQLGINGGGDVMLEQTSAMCVTINNTEKVSIPISINMTEFLSIADQVPALRHTTVNDSTKKVLFGFNQKTE